MIKILILDDEVDITMSITKLVERIPDVRCFPAYAGHEAMALLEKENPDILILDYLLLHEPITGLDVYRKAHELNPGALGCILTGNASAKERCRQAGIKHFIDKPTLMPDILRYVKGLVADYRK